MTEKIDQNRIEIYRKLIIKIINHRVKAKLKHTKFVLQTKEENFLNENKTNFVKKKKALIRDHP